MSSFINHFKKTAKQNAEDLQDNEHGVVGQWQDYPTNWEQEQDKDQSELERIELMRDELRRDEPVEQESEEREYCFSLRDTL